jgi:hypothetical protein
VGNDGQLPNSDTPDDVVLYDLSAFPNLGGRPGEGNSILAGNLDSGNRPCRGGTVPPPCRAVFWGLRELQRGDEVHVFWEQRAFVYRVVGFCWTTREEVPEPLYRTTSGATATLITGGGTFVQGRGYSHVIYVRAEASSGTLGTECPVGSSSPPPTPVPTPRS